MQNFRLFQTAIMFFKKCKCVSMPRHLREQLDRASASISCNIGEDYGRSSKLDKRRFYRIALGSTRECRTLLILAEHEDPELMGMLDFLGGGLYELSRWLDAGYRSPDERAGVIFRRLEIRLR